MPELVTILMIKIIKETKMKIHLEKKNKEFFVLLPKVRN